VYDFVVVFLCGVVFVGLGFFVEFGWEGNFVLEPFLDAGCLNVLDELGDVFWVLGVAAAFEVDQYRSFFCDDDVFVGVGEFEFVYVEFVECSELVEYLQECFFNFVFWCLLKVVADADSVYVLHVYFCWGC